MFNRVWTRQIADYFPKGLIAFDPGPFVGERKSDLPSSLHKFVSNVVPLKGHLHGRFCRLMRFELSGNKHRSENNIKLSRKQSGMYYQTLCIRIAQILQWARVFVQACESAYYKICQFSINYESVMFYSIGPRSQVVFTGELHIKLLANLSPSFLRQGYLDYKSFTQNVMITICIRHVYTN